MNPLNFAVPMRIIYLIVIFFFFLVPLVEAFPSDLNFSSTSAEFNPFEENGKFGIKNTSGDILIPAQYDKLGWSNGKFSIIENITGYKQNNKWGILNLENQKITKAEFEEVFPGQGNIILVRKQLPNSIKILTGGINTLGKPVIPIAYETLKINSLRAIASEKTGTSYRYGLIDLSNNVLIPLIYNSIYPIGSLRYSVVSKMGKAAIFTEDGKQLTDFSIDSISGFKRNYAVIYQNFFQGLINREGQIVLKPVYREIKINENGVKARKADMWQFLEGDSREKRRFNADSITGITATTFKVKIGESFFLADRELRPLSDQVFNKVGTFANGKAIFTQNRNAGVVRKNGSIIVKPVFKNIFIDEKFIRAVDHKLKWSLLDTAGRVLSPKQYDYIGPHNKSFLPVKSKGFWGAVNQQGKEIVACVHDSLVHTKSDLIVVKFKGLYGIVRTNERWVVTPQIHPLKILTDDRYLSYENGNQFIKSLTGDVIYFTSNKIDFKDGFLLEHLADGTVVKVTMNGQVDRFELTPGIQNVFPESEGYRAIRRDGKFGFIDNRSRLRIANRYDDVKNFSEGMAGIKLLGKWGFISKEDKIIVQPVYDEVSAFRNDHAIVRQKNLYGVIDKTGKVIIPIRYDDIQLLDSKRYKVQQNGLFGLIGATGQIIINVKYNSLEDLNNGFIIVKQDDKWGVITSDGVSTIPLIYDALQFDSINNEYVAMKKSEWEEMGL